MTEPKRKVSYSMTDDDIAKLTKIVESLDAEVRGGYGSKGLLSQFSVMQSTVDSIQRSVNDLPSKIKAEMKNVFNVEVMKVERQILNQDRVIELAREEARKVVAEHEKRDEEHNIGAGTWHEFRNRFLIPTVVGIISVIVTAIVVYYIGQ